MRAAVAHCKVHPAAAVLFRCCRRPNPPALPPYPAPRPSEPDTQGIAANLAAASGGAGRIVLTWTPATNATINYVFGIKKPAATARDFSSLAAWSFSDRPNAHTVSGLE